MASTIKLKNGSGAPLAGDLVQGEPALDLTNKRLYTEDSGGNVIEVGVNPTSITTGTITASGEITANGGIALGDNDKATFGASGDLEIYHTGTTSYIRDVGDGDLQLFASDDVYIRGYATNNYMARFRETGSVDLYHNNSLKFQTTSTGIDVTGTVTADGLTVDGDATIAATTPLLTLSSASQIWAGGEDLGGINWYTKDASGDGPMVIARLKSNSVGANTLPLPEFTFQTSVSSSALLDRLKIHNNGDISFYEDTGTTAKFFWDASAESLIVGGSTQFNSAALTADGGVNGTHAVFSGQASRGLVISTANTLSNDDGVIYNAQTSSGKHIWQTTGTERMRIDSSGNVGIGTTSPNKIFEVAAANTGASENNTIRITDLDTAVVANQPVGSIEWYTSDGNAVTSKIGAVYVGSGAGSNLVFSTAPSAATGISERMRIDSSGNLLVGTTAAGASNNNGFTAEPYAGGMVINVGHNGSAANGDGYVFFRRNGTALGSITQVSSTGVSYNITSDERLKENIVDTTHTVDINDIKVRQYDWKSNGEHQRYGFIAQELEAVYPEAVFSPEDPEEMKAVDYSKLVPLLVKEIQDLKAEVAALKGA